MSIQCVHTSESNEEGVALKMTVGSSIEISPNTTSPSADINKSEKCFALPYQDHDYDVLSKSNFIYEDNDAHLESFNRDKHNIVSVSPIADNLSNPQNTNGFNDIDSNSCQSATTDYSDINDITRCICGFVHDDGYMICCDKCSVWQHIDCMQIDRNAIPESYCCEQCQPRVVDSANAIRLQTLKREEFINHDSDTGTEDEHSRDVENITYMAVQSTPTSMTITTNRNKRDTHSTGKKRKRSSDSQPNHKRICRDGKKRPQARYRSKSLLSTCNEADSSWIEEIKKWSNSYITKEDNDYSEFLKEAVHEAINKPQKNIDNINTNGIANDDHILKKLSDQLARVQQLRNSLLAIEDIAAGQPIIEYKGSFSLKNSFEKEGNDVTKRPYPYVLFYSGFDGVDICVDSRYYGNSARFVRRSCCPNSEIRHVLDSGNLRLFIFCKDQIKKDSEITIPFDFKFEDCSYAVSCSCGKGKECPVYVSACSKGYLNLNKRRLNKFDLPFRVPIGGIPQLNGYASSDDLGDSDDIHQRKKSREERKMESYIRAFKEMEKKEKKKELLQQQQHVHKNVPGLVRPLIDEKSNISSLVISETKPENVNGKNLPTTTATVVSLENVSTEKTVPVPEKCQVRRKSVRARQVSRRFRTSESESDSILNSLIPQEKLDNASDILTSQSSLDKSETISIKTMENSHPVLTTPSQSPTSNEFALPCTTSNVAFSTTLTTISTGTTPNSESEYVVTKDSIILQPLITLPQATVFTSTMNSMVSNSWQASTTVVTCSDTCRTSISLKLVKSSSKQKRPSSTVDWMVGRSISPVLTGRPRSASICNPKTAEESVHIPSRNLLFGRCLSPVNNTECAPVLNCNLVPWDFRPGVPTGKICIHTHNFHKPRRKVEDYFSLKKRWLQQNTEETKDIEDVNTLHNKDNDVTKQNKLNHYTDVNILPIKKRYGLPSFPLLSCEDQAIDIKTSNGSQTKSHLQNESDKNISLLANDTELKADLSSSENSLGNEEGDNLINAEVENMQLPVTEENKVSSLPQLSAEPYIQESETTSVDVSSVVCSDIFPVQTVAGDIENNTPQPAVVKRKVSLQEYLKRPKLKEVKSNKSTLSKPTVKPVIEEVTKSQVQDQKTLPSTNINKEVVKTNCSDNVAINDSKSNTTKESLANSGETVAISVSPNNIEKKQVVKENNDTILPTSKNEIKESEIKVLNTNNSIRSPVTDIVEKTSATQASPVANVNLLSINKQTEVIHSKSSVESNIDIADTKPIEYEDNSAEMHLSPKLKEKQDFVSKNVIKIVSNDTVSVKEKEEKVETPPRSPAPYSPVVNDDRPSSYTRSRHNSNTSTNSSKSPLMVQDYHRPRMHEIKSPTVIGSKNIARRNSGSRIWNGPNNFRVRSPPKKVPSLAPAVPGQPIPSLMRTGDGRGPQRIYNRESPRRDIRSPSPGRWRPPSNPSQYGMGNPRGIRPGKYRESSNTHWRRHEHETDFRRDNFTSGGYPPPNYSHSYSRQNSGPLLDDRPYSPKTYYHSRPDYYNDHYSGGSFHDRSPQDYSPRGFSPNNNNNNRHGYHTHY